MNPIPRKMALMLLVALGTTSVLAQETTESTARTKAAYSLRSVPDWVYDSVFDLDSGYGEGVRNETDFRTLGAMGVDVVSARVRMHTEDVDDHHLVKERVAAVSAAGKKLNLRWFGYFIACHDVPLATAHSDWRVHDRADGKLDPVNIYTFLCFNSPWRGVFLDKLTRLEKDYRPDGFLIDGWNYISPFCYCDYCKKAYRDAAGKEIPLKADLDDPDYCRYMRWRDQVKIDLAVQTRDELKKINPDVALMPWIVTPGRWWHMETPAKNLYKYETEAINRLADFPLIEMYWDWPLDQGGTVMADFALRYNAGVRAGRPFGVSPNCAAHGQQPTRIPKVEEAYRTCSIIAAGASAAPTWSWMGRREDYRDMVRLIRERLPFTKRAVSHKWAAMVSSENTRFYYGRDKLRDKYMFHCLGAFRALQEEHLPFDVITDMDLEEGGAALSDYKVILLPNTACLSDRAVANLRAHVENGGGLVATHESTLYDQDAKRRPDFALGDLFGARFEAVENHTGVWPEEASDERLIPGRITYTDHPIFIDAVIERSFIGDVHAEPAGKVMRQTDFFGKGINVTATSDTQVVATRSGITDQDQWPAVMVSKHGKGWVVYFPGGIDDAYFRLPMPFERRLLVNAVRWASAAPPPVEVEAPKTVSVTCFDQDSVLGKCLMIHLLNQVNTTAGRSLPAGSPPQREEVLPVHGIKVRLSDKRIRKVTQQPEGLDLELQNSADGVTVTVPRLDIHSILVAERGE